MSNAVECMCGNIFVTSKEGRTQCKCGKRFSIHVHQISMPSLKKNAKIHELNTIIDKQKNIIEKFIHSFESNNQNMTQLVKKYHSIQ